MRVDCMDRQTDRLLGLPVLCAQAPCKSRTRPDTHSPPTVSESLILFDDGDFVSSLELELVVVFSHKGVDGGDDERHGGGRLARRGGMECRG